MADNKGILNLYDALKKAKAPKEGNLDFNAISSEIAGVDIPEEATPEVTPEAPISARQRLETYLNELEKGGGKDRNTAQWVDAINSMNQGLRASMGMKPVGQAPSAEAALDRKQDQKLTSLAQLAKLEEKPAATQPKLMSLPQGIVAVSPDGKGGFNTNLIHKAEPKALSESEKADIEYKLAGARQRNAIAGLAKPKFDLSKEKFAHTKEEKAEISTKQQSKFGDDLGFVGKIDQIIKKASPEQWNKEESRKAIKAYQGIGPVQARYNDAVATYGSNSAEAIALAGEVRRISADYIKAMSGTAVNEKEYERLSKALPNMSMNPKVFLAQLQSLRNSKQIEMLADLDAYQAGGQDVTKLRNQAHKIFGVKYADNSAFAPEKEAAPAARKLKPEVEAQINSQLKGNANLNRDSVLQILFNRMKTANPGASDAAIWDALSSDENMEE